MPDSSIDRELLIKKASELLRSGATMLAETCPICHSPLFKLKSGEIVCPIHGRVMLVKSEEEVSKASVESVLTELEKVIAIKLSGYINMLKSGREVDYEEIRNLISWLDALERIEKIKLVIHKSSEMAVQRKGKEQK